MFLGCEKHGNIPVRKQGDEFMVNTRDEVLHARTFAPADGQDIKALVVFQHGYVCTHMRSLPWRWNAYFCRTFQSAEAAKVVG